MIKIFSFLLLVCFCCCGYAQPGLLDPSFGNGGIVRADLGVHMNYAAKGIQVIAGTGDEAYMLYQTGKYSLIAKKKIDGSPDSTYGFSGYSVRVVMTGVKAVLQQDGKIVVAGYLRPLFESKGDGDNICLVRFNSNGGLDSSFGNNGLVINNLDGSVQPADIALQDDGKIVLVGRYFEFSTSLSKQYLVIARYNENGQLDKTFSGDGIQEGSMYSEFNYAFCITIRADGKILIGGYSILFVSVDGTIEDTYLDEWGFPILNDIENIAVQPDGKLIGIGNGRMIRYDVNGSPDSSFGIDGLLTTTSSKGQLKLLSDGKILLTAINNNGDVCISRYNINGTLDSSFSEDGKAIAAFGGLNDDANSVAYLSNGKLIALGNNTNPVLASYNADATVDSSYGNNGLVNDNLSGSSTFFTSHAEQTDCKVIAAGYTWNGNDYDFVVMRYNENGSVDANFGVNGKTITDIGSDDRIKSIAISNDGIITVAGSSGNDIALARYNGNGEPDFTFGNNGIVVSDFNGIDYANAVALMPNGKIIAGGSTVVRYNQNGTIDDSFAGDGKIDWQQYSNYYKCRDIAVINNNRIVVLWEVFDASLVVWYDEFGVQYKEALISDMSGTASSNITAGSLAVQKDGKILVCGKFEYTYRSYSSYAFVTRLDTNGIYDQSFNNGHILYMSWPGLGYATSVMQQDDNKIIVAGYVVNEKGSDFAISRYISNGFQDTTFGAYGTQVISVGGGDDVLFNATLSCKKQLYASGYSTGNPGTYGTIIRLYPSSEGGSLPVRLADFKASLQNKNVLLQWQTEAEESLAGFDIQRSDDGVHFNTIGYVAAHGGISTLTHYSLFDKQPLPGLNYYRLKMVDIDGKYTYSITAAVRLIKTDAVIQLSPNPAKNTLYVEAAAGIKEVAIKIIGVDGRKWKDMKIYFSSNKEKIDISKLPAGIYVMQVYTKFTVETMQFLKE